MNLILILTLAATLFLGIFWILKKIIGLSVSPFLGILFIYLGGFIFTLVVYFITRPELQFNLSFKKGIFLALLAGILIAAFDLINLIVFKKGGNVTWFFPLVSGGSILIAATVGLLFLKESINFFQFIGIVAIIGGIILLAK